MTRFFKNFLTLLIFLYFPIDAKYPDLSPKIVHAKSKEIMNAHATHKELTPELVKRILNLYTESLDPTKTYFISSDIKQWTDPSDQELQKYLTALNKKDYSVFYKIYEKMGQKIPRHRKITASIDLENLPQNVSAKEFKDLQWVDTESELKERLERIKALQIETSAKLSEDVREKALQRIEKRQKNMKRNF